MDTIAAISTAPGRGAIAVVRLSGPQAVQVASEVYRGREKLEGLDSHSVRYGRVFDSSGDLIDEVLIALMRAPESYTGEDVVEISCHGGPLASQLVLAALVEAGARQAEPGEFTKRAFLNGKMDLAQAEAVAELVGAKTRKAYQRALNQLEGEVSVPLRDLRSTVVEALAELEARIDFPEDVPEPLDAEAVVASLQGVVNGLKAMASDSISSARLSTGARVPIVGRPNVGKSSLLNSIAGHSRCIVNPVPGTTRDTIEEEIDLDGIPVILVDTAGLRSAEEEVEEEGVRRSKDEIRRADLVVYVVDASAQDYRPDSEILESLNTESDGRVLVVVNKIDLAQANRAVSALAGQSVRDPVRDPGRDRAGDSPRDPVRHPARVTARDSSRDSASRPEPSDGPGSSGGGQAALKEVSAKDGIGIESLERALAQTILGIRLAVEEAHCAGQRHTVCLNAAIANIERATGALSTQAPQELVAFELREAAQHLGSITGDTVGMDVLDSIFSRFCVGK
jgi:tRNA modification GTPase